MIILSDELLRARMPDLATSDTASMIMNTYHDMRIDISFVQLALVVSPGC